MMKGILWMYVHIFICSFVSLSVLVFAESIWTLSEAMRLVVFCSVLFPFYGFTKGWFVKKKHASDLSTRNDNL